MSKKHIKEEEQNINEQTNNESTCECETNEDSGCSGSCAGCSGCGSIDPEMMIQILGSRNKELEEKYMRLQAEFLNFKTRTQESKHKLIPI